MRRRIDPTHPRWSIRQQCELLGLARSILYDQPAEVDPEDLALMARMDREHIDHPFFGSWKLAEVLSTPESPVNRKRVPRLMRVMGLETLYCGPKATVTDGCHRVYPYLLRGVPITHVGQVWPADITYIPMPSGFLYLVATIDWFSRHVVSWRRSNTLDGWFCDGNRSRPLRQQ